MKKRMTHPARVAYVDAIKPRKTASALPEASTMKTLTTFILLLAGIPALASPLFPMASVPDFTDGDGWHIVVGAGLEYETEYDGADDYSTEAEPGLIVQKRKGNQVWFLEGQELGWRGRIDDVWLLQGGLRLEGGREESESEALTGLGDTDDELTAMFEARRAIGGSWNNWVASRVMAGGSDIGWLGVLAAGKTIEAGSPGSAVDVFLFTTFGSDAFINRDFGVTETQAANSGLAATDISGGYRSVGVQAAGRWRIGDSWQLQAEAAYERYSSDIADSPIAVDDYEAEIGLSLLYRF